MAAELPIAMDQQAATRLQRLLRLDIDRLEQQADAQRPSPRAQPVPLTYKAVITASAIDPAAPDRYLYGHAELKKAAAGASGWTTLAGGRSGTIGSDPARNWAEGLYGEYLASGVKKSGLPGTFKQPPIPVNSVVTMEIHQNPDGTPEYWFERGAVPDGECA